MTITEKSYPIFYPPEATDTEPVGHMEVHESLGGWVVRASLDGYKPLEGMVEHGAFLKEARVKRLERRLLGMAHFQASLIYDQPSAIETATI